MSKARDLANAGTALTTVSATELGYLDGVTSAVQTQIDSKIGQSTAINPSTVTTKGDILVATGSGTLVRQGVGTDGQFLQAASAQADGVQWATVSVPPQGNIKEVVFTTSNTSYAIPSGVTAFWFLAVGGGGGGGGAESGFAAAGGGGGQVIENFFTVTGDTTLNITIGAGGAGGASTPTAGSNGGTTTIIGNTSSTTYASSLGGGGGGAAKSAPAANGSVGASGGGEGAQTNISGGGRGGNGGGFRADWEGRLAGSYNTSIRGVTGFGGAPQNNGGSPIPYFTWNRQLSTGGPDGSSNTTTSIGGNGFRTAANVTPTAATANSGSGGAGFRSSTSGGSAGVGGAGGSGLVVLRYVG